MGAKKYGVRTSAAQFFFYFTWIITGAITFRSVINRKIDSEELAYNDPDATDRVLVVYSIQYGLVVIMFVLNCFADAEPKKYDERIKILKNPCPQLKASFLSRLTYVWATPLLWRGFRNPLTAKDLWNVDPKITSRGIVPQFDYHLDPIMQKHKEKVQSSGAVPNNRATMSGSKGSLKLNTEADIKKKQSFSIFPAMFKTFGPMFFAGGAMKIIYGKISLYFKKNYKSNCLHFLDGMQMISPQLMKLMIGFVTASAIGDGAEESWKGYFYAALLLANTMFQVKPFGLNL